MLAIKTPEIVGHELAQRLRERRLERSWSREELAERSGVKASNIKRFELSGEIALTRLLQLAFVLEGLDSFQNVLLSPPPLTMAELKKHTKKRLRGRRKNR